MIISYILNKHHSSTNEWEEVYKYSFIGTVHNQNRSYAGYSGDFYVRDVYFSNLGNEGVIHLNSSDVKSLISSCSFENSNNKDNEGGSIYSKNGQCSIRKVCSFGSYSKYGLFCTIFVPDNTTSINEIQGSTVAFSIGVGMDVCAIYLNYGNTSFLRNNVTKNDAHAITALSINSGEGNSLIRYSIINANDANNYICSASDKSSKYRNSVLTNNTSWRDVLFSLTNSDVTFENCFIANNNYVKYFFSENSGSITIYKSYIDSKQICESNQDVRIIPYKKVSIELQFLSTELCPGSSYFVYEYKQNNFTDPIRFKDFKSPIKRKR